MSENFNSYYYEYREKFLNRYSDEKYSQMYPDLFSEEFANYCVEEIFPIIEETAKLNNNEAEKRFSRNISILFSIAAFIGFICFPIIIFSSVILKTEVFLPYIPFIFISFAASIILIFFYGVSDTFSFAVAEKRINNIKKKKIFPKLFSLFSHCEYVSSEKQIFEMKNYMKNLSLLVNRGGFYPDTFEDFFHLKYKGLDIDLCEFILSGVSVTLYTSNKNVIRKGCNSLFYRIPLEISSNAEIFIRKRMYSKTKIKGCEEIAVLESKEFNDLYVVETTNQIDLRLFLTPSFMERLITFSKEYPNYEFALSFEKGYMNVHFSASEFDLFEINGIEKDDKETRIKKLIFAMIDLQEHLMLVDILSPEDIISY
ncbi:MAG: DUF3137 domain-containing protein [Cyanobacteria bacterium SIG29]|nr:DUF3137 domain-containing protein [Cyanobacteria bacterium SIG29]